MTTIRHLFYFLLALSVTAHFACGSGTKEKESEIVHTEDGDWLSFDKTHETWSTASRVIGELMEGARFGDMGMMPISESSGNDFSNIFPEQLGDYNQSPYDPQMSKKQQYAWLRLYEREDEKLLFTVYRFDSPLNMLNFFVTLDSMYRENPQLVVDEIQLGQKSGWTVTDGRGKSKEVCIMIDDYTFLQVDVSPEFSGDVLELVGLLDF